MAKIGKIIKGTVKGVVGVGCFVGGVIVKSVEKATFGFILPDQKGGPIQEAKELSKFWLEDAQKDFEDAFSDDMHNKR